MAPNILLFDVLAGPRHTLGKNRSVAARPLTGFPNLRTSSPVLGPEQVTRVQTPGMTAGAGTAWDASRGDSVIITPRAG